MSKHSRKNVIMVVVIVALAMSSTYFFMLHDSEERPDGAVSSAIRDEGPVEPANIKNETNLQSTEEGLYLKRDNGEEVKIQIQGASVGSFPPTQSQPSK